MSESKRVSVIITTYNHAHYLPQSINSVLTQDYSNIEVIVVDDGSTDNTKEVVSQYPQVKYVHQINQGLSAARNTGIDHSDGDYLVFLDADDWFLEGAFTTSVAVLEATPQAAFVYGKHMKVNEKNEISLKVREDQYKADDHYRYLLHYNFIVMHATVFYRRWVFNEFRYDTSLRACEDYDMYLKITRLYPVVYNNYLVAAYRKYSQSMSGNIPLMITTVLEVMRRQKPLLRTEKEKEWFAKGMRFWKGKYGGELFKQIVKYPFSQFQPKRRKELFNFFAGHKRLTIQYIFLKPSFMTLKSLIKKKSPSFILSLMKSAGLYKNHKPAVGKIRRGDFNTTKPFSTKFGYDRGGPVDRYYIENFLEKNAPAIKGRVLEIADNEYTLRFGGSKVTQSDILHVEDTNEKATFIGDLSNAPHLPDNSFDCIVLTQTLQFIYHHHDALRTCFRILKPGGTLLLTVPGITHNDQGDDWNYYWLWTYTKASLNRMLTETFPEERVQTEAFGNVLVATAFLYGVGLPEMKKQEMDAHDPHYQVIITAKATKPLSA
jgi:glycosyltransferase involved in cell wall biosynthesis/SAM-dependent methyltransferase